MSYLKIKLHLKKYKDLPILEKIKCVSRNEYYYFPPENQFISKVIRKRTKLSYDEKIQISYAIGAKYSRKAMLKEL